MSSEAEPQAARTPFSIADILGPRRVPRGPSALQLPEWSPAPVSPLCALEELTSKAFRGLDGHALQPSEGRAIATEKGRREGDKRPEPRLQTSRAAPGALGRGRAGCRRRKSRTAFTAQQVLELERRFVFQKYLAPSERNRLAAGLGLASAQVLTWFQNRRAKLKREVEEMRADVASLRALAAEVQGRCALQDGAPSLGLRPLPALPDSGPHLSDEEIHVDD